MFAAIKLAESDAIVIKLIVFTVVVVDAGAAAVKVRDAITWMMLMMMALGRVFIIAR